MAIMTGLQLTSDAVQFTTYELYIGTYLGKKTNKGKYLLKINGVVL